jgi:transposase
VEHSQNIPLLQCLRPLPAERFEFGTWKTARVNIDYHVEIDQHYYSVPYTLTGQKVEVRSTGTTVEIFQNGRRVASHARSETPYDMLKRSATAEPHHRDSLTFRMAIRGQT